MNRTSKALARMGVGAVTVATLLAMPFAIGSASADPPAFPASGLTTTPGTVNDGTAFTTCPNDGRAPGAAEGTKTIVASPQTGNNGGQAIFCVFEQNVGSAGTTVNLAIAGTTTAYFPTAQGTGTVQNTAQSATCTTVLSGNGNSYCQVDVADIAAEGVTVTASNGSNTAQQPVNFDGLAWDPCHPTGINTIANCTFQGTINTQTPLTLHYTAGPAAGATKLINLQLPGTDNAVFSASQPSNVQIVDSTHARCTTDNTGTCAPNILDSTAQTTKLLAYITPGNAAPYPGDTAAIPADGDLDSADITVTFGAASVQPGELDLIKTTLITPTGQAPALAEPGDVIQNQYQLLGAPLQQGQGSCANPQCPGTVLANTTLTLKVSNGFFTPNCVFPASTSPASFGNNTYANCTFNTAAANAAKVGDLKQSGQSIDVKTDASGMVIVSLGIAKDAGFDDNGLVTATVTSGSLASQASGDTNLPTSTTCGTSVTPIQPTTAGPISPPTGTTFSGCDVDVEWTTDEAPLNGGTAKDVVVPAIRNPNNNFIETENNDTATDTGTSNVPDVDRVVFVVHLTDQFGNLTSNRGAGGSPTGATITKTGPGNIVRCTSFTNIDACSGGSQGTEDSATTQPDGTVTQVEEAEGSYTNNVAGHFSPHSPGQFRYEADANTADTDDVVNCYPLDCSDIGHGVPGDPGVNDGTQTDVTSWNPETSVFTLVVPGTATTPAASNYTFGAAATASTDTLTINFYNQLAQAVVTFSVKPGHKVPTSTAVTVVGTVSDQFQHPIVDADMQIVRSGANEPSCTPVQDNNTNQFIPTNQAGKAGYTFSCNQAGASTVNVVVTGPGGTQLAAGKEVIHFTGSSAHLTKEKPTLKVKSPGHHLILKVATHPAVHGKTVLFYRLKHGLPHLLGAAKTGKSGHAKLKLHVKSGHYQIEAKVSGLKATKFNSKYSKTKSTKV